VSRDAVARRLVTFGIGTAWYAVDVAHVERVLRHEGVFPIPNMPPWMEGMIEYRGRIVPVINLGQRLGLDVPSGGGARRLLVLTLGEDVVAAAVDQVVDVRPVADGDVAPPPALVRGVAGECLRGVLRRDDTMVLLLDVARLLHAADRRAIDHCLAPPDVDGPTSAPRTADVPVNV